MFADIILPATTSLEREDIHVPWSSGPYYVYMQQAIDPMYEAKSDHDICVELAPCLGIADYDTDVNDEGRLHKFVESNEYIVDFDRFRKEGIVKIGMEKSFVAFAEEVKDPAGHPFLTVSGKIELYSELFAEMGNPEVPPVAKYLSIPEGYDDPRADKYPLQLLTTHHESTTHSVMEKLPWLEEVSPKRLWINSRDAAARGVADDDEVLVYNDRGTVRIKAWVTERIMPGVVNIPQGGWFDIDSAGVDQGGCANILVQAEHTPGGAWMVNTSLVEVRKA
jgi:anaerobic dimethyl sulfoxide reductase subunit A